MIRKLTLTAAVAIMALGAPLASRVHAEEGGNVKDIAFSFEGPFGVYDRNQLQRGLQVYTEVCSACHGLKYVPIRTLGDPGGPQLPEKQVRAYAAQMEIDDPETGDTRPRKPSDFFPPHVDPNAPDLSLMAKARKGFSGPHGLLLNQLFRGIGGPEYIVAILTGFDGEEKTIAGSTFYGNHAFPGGWIAMPPPLSDGQVEFADGSPNDVKHMAEDVAAFLMWTAEPKLEARKHAGFDAVFYLVLLASLLYLTNKRLWAPVKGKKVDL